VAVDVGPNRKMQPQVILLLLTLQWPDGSAPPIPSSYPGTGICWLGLGLNALWECGMLGVPTVD